MRGPVEPARSPVPGDLPLPAPPARFSAPLTSPCPHMYACFHVFFFLGSRDDRYSAQTSLYHFTIPEPFRNNSSHPKNLLKGADFSVCTRHYFNRKRKLVAQSISNRSFPLLTTFFSPAPFIKLSIHIVQINRANTPKHAPLHKSTKNSNLRDT